MTEENKPVLYTLCELSRFFELVVTAKLSVIVASLDFRFGVNCGA